MRGKIRFLHILIISSFALSAYSAHAQSFAPGAEGISSAWHRESIDIASGTLRLEIPLYSARSADMFGWSVVLSYDSRVWDAADYNPSSPPGGATRRLIGRQNAGLGWKISFGRVYSETYISGGTTERYYYFEGQGGDTHRLFRQGTLQPTCQPDPYWYALDGSGIRAQSSPSDPEGSPSATTWTVWYPDGTKITLGHYEDYDLNISLPPDTLFHGWYATAIAGPQPKNGTSERYSIQIVYYPQHVTSPACPQTITDNSSPPRVVQITCEAGPIPMGRKITAVEVPAPSTSGTQTYQLSYTTHEVFDPFECRKSSLDPLALIFSRPGPIVDGFLDVRAVRAGGRRAG